MICPASIPLVSCGEWFISMNWYEQDCEFHFFTNDSVNGVHIPFTDVQRSCFHPNLTYKLLFPTGQISQLPLHLLESRSLLAIFVSSAMLPVDSLDNKTGRRHPPSTCWVQWSQQPGLNWWPPLYENMKKYVNWYFLFLPLLLFLHVN